MSKAACLRCRTHHANPTTFGSWDENGGWNATDEDIDLKLDEMRLALEQLGSKVKVEAPAEGSTLSL